MNGIQTQVGAQQAVAVAGDFASGNPRAFVDAGQGALVAGAAGVTIGKFAWWSGTQIDNDGAPAVVNSFGHGVPTGVVHRQQQGLITIYLADASMVIVPGTEMALMSAGDIWIVNNGAAAVQVGMKAYANFTNGNASFAITGTPGSASATGSIAAGAGASATGVINGNIFTATASLSGTFVVGGVLTGSGVATGSTILSQVLPLAAGEALGGLGRYVVSIPEQTVVSTTISESWGVFTAASALSGTFAPGMPLSGPGGSSDPVAAGTYIVSQLTGTAGGLGTYVVNLTQTSSSATVTAGVTVETKWIAMSNGLPGELVKISTWPLG